MRLFVAIQFSTEVRQVLLRVQDVLRQQGHGRFSLPENFHLTLAFIGETERLTDAIHAIEQIHTRPFPVTLSGIGHFGDLYWAGAVLTQPLADLQAQVSRALTANGFSLPDREFCPHLTLCRRYCPGNTLVQRAAEMALGQPTCIIDRVELMESRPAGANIVYIPRFKQKLY